MKLSNLLQTSKVLQELVHRLLLSMLPILVLLHLKTPGGCAGRYQYGNDWKDYGWDYEPNIGGAPGQNGKHGITYRYQEYRWNTNKIVVYNAEELAAASIPGKAGNVTYNSLITYDSSLT